MSNFDKELDEIRNILGVPKIARIHPEKYADKKKRLQEKLLLALLRRVERGASEMPTPQEEVGGKQVDTLSVALTSDDIELLLDCINAQMTQAKWKINPKRGEAVYELYQTIGQALGEADIKLQFRVTGLANTCLADSTNVSNPPSPELEAEL